MSTTQQPEAMRLANEFKLCNEYDSIPSMNDIAKAEAELRRQHAENTALQQGYDAARMEIEGLRDRVQELGAMLRENRSKRIVELEAKLAAIGAGGVEPLRRRECLHKIAEPAPAAVAGPSDSEIDALVASIGPTEGIRRDSRDLTMDKLRVLVRRALATWGHVNAAPAAQVDAEDAARWRETLMHIGAANHLGGQHFTLNTLRITDQMFLLRGSVAQHFAKCIDASRAARSQAKEGGA